MLNAAHTYRKTHAHKGHNDLNYIVKSSPRKLINTQLIKCVHLLTRRSICKTNWKSRNSVAAVAEKTSWFRTGWKIHKLCWSTLKLRFTTRQQSSKNQPGLFTNWAHSLPLFLCMFKERESCWCWHGNDSHGNVSCEEAQVSGQSNANWRRHPSLHSHA